MLNPILREKGIVSLLGVPLVAGGKVLGVLHVGTLTRRRFTEQDAELLQMVADRAAMTTQSRISQTERAAAAVMPATCCPPGYRRLTGWSSPPAMSPAATARSGVTGTTCSPCPRARSAWWSEMWSGTASRRRSR